MPLVDTEEVISLSELTGKGRSSAPDRRRGSVDCHLSGDLGKE